VSANYQKSDKIDYINYQVISLLSTAYEVLPNTFLYIVTPYVEKIIGYFRCGFPLNVHDGPHTVSSSETGVRIVGR
jgi:hypothetical protein